MLFLILAETGDHLQGFFVGYEIGEGPAQTPF
jgi:hypothetical protein